MGGQPSVFENKYVNEQGGDIESSVSSEFTTNLGIIPLNTSVLVDVYQPGYPDPDDPFLKRHNVKESFLNAAEMPIIFWYDHGQRKYRFYYSVKIFSGTTNGQSNVSFTLRRRSSPLRIKIADEGQNYTLATARTVWFGFRGRMEAYHWETASTRWYGQNCYQAVLPHGNNPQLLCPFKNEAAGVQGTCSPAHFGSNPSQGKLPHFCWIDLTGYTFYELCNITNGGAYEGVEELKVDGRPLY